MKPTTAEYAGNYYWAYSPEYIGEIYKNGKFFRWLRFGFESIKEKQNCRDLGFRLCRKKTK